MRKQSWFYFLLTISFLLIIVKGIFLLQRPFIDNDEGIYLTTFLLVSKGHKLYKEVFFSQLPGFFLLVYPGFVTFGKSLIAARLMVFFWSLIGMIGVIWLFKEMKKTWLSMPVILSIWAIPKYFNQATIVQSDSLATSLSLLSLVSLITYFNKEKIIWFFLSTVFFSLAILTKLDMTVGMALFLVLYSVLKKNNFKNWQRFLSIIILVPILVFFTFYFFGFKAVINNTFGFRLLAAKIYPIFPNTFWQFLVDEKLLFGLVIIFLIQLVIGIIKRKVSFFSYLTFSWLFLTFGFVLFFRPIFTHHLSLLVIPLLISLILLISDYYQLENRYWLVIIVVVVLIFLQTTSIKKFPTLQNRQESDLTALIKNQTKETDFIVIDEAKFYYLTKRLPPPELADISYVRVESESLSRENFRTIVINNKPKLIILWNGRLEKLPNLKQDLTSLGYKIINQYGKTKVVYRL